MIRYHQPSDEPCIEEPHRTRAPNQWYEHTLSRGLRGRLGGLTRADDATAEVNTQTTKSLKERVRACIIAAGAPERQEALSGGARLRDVGDEVGDVRRLLGPQCLGLEVDLLALRLEVQVLYENTHAYICQSTSDRTVG